MINSLPITISVLALAISFVTAWLTFFRRGTVKMTRPTFIAFAWDTSPGQKTSFPKVFIRTLLFATSKRGCVVESIHVSLSRNESYQSFNIWAYGVERLERGSGLFVGETGIATNHHFLPPWGESSFRFIEGRYRLDIFARLTNDKVQKLLFSQDLEISKEEGIELENPNTALYFDWGPDSSRYLTHVKKELIPRIDLGGR